MGTLQQAAVWSKKPPKHLLHFTDSHIPPCLFCAPLTTESTNITLKPKQRQQDIILPAYCCCSLVPGCWLKLASPVYVYTATELDTIRYYTVILDQYFRHYFICLTVQFMTLQKMLGSGFSVKQSQ